MNVLQLGAEHAGVQIVKPAVEPEAVDVPLVRSVIAQLPQLRVDVGVVRDQRAAVAERAEVLLDDEARRRRIAELADSEPGAGGIDRLRVVLDDAELVPIGDVFDRRHVGALAVQVHGNDRFRLRRDRRFDPRRIDAPGLRIAVDEHGCGAGDPDRFGCGEERVRVRDDLVARSYAHRHQCQPDRVGAVPGADGVRHPVKRGQLLLELLEHRPLHVLTTLEHALQVRVYLRLNVLVLP